MGNTARGAPFPDATDAPNVPSDLGALAAWVNDRPGISTLTYAQINALAGAELWAGRRVYQTDTGTDRPFEGEYTFNGVAWRLPWNLGWGEQGRGVDTTSANHADAAEHVIAGAVTFTAVDNRKYRIGVDAVVRNNAAAVAGIVFRLKVDGTLVEQARDIAFDNAPTVDVYFAFTVEIGTLAAGPRVASLTVQSSNAAGYLLNGPAAPTVITVDDLGPSGAPA